MQGRGHNPVPVFVREVQGIDKSPMVRLSSADDRNCARA